MQELAVPADRIAGALTQGATPGFHGQVRIEFSLTDRALEGVAIETVRMQKVRVGDLAGAPAPASKTIDIRLRDAAHAMAKRLRLRLTVGRITAHYQDGRLQAFDIEDCP